MIGVSGKSLESALSLRLATRTINQFPKVIGNFEYDILNDVATVDDTQQHLLGLDKKIVSFVDVMKIIDITSSESFQEGLTRMVKEQSLVTDELQLTNGNIIQETYRCEYHTDDYEHRSPIKIIGSSQLLKVA